MKSFSFAWLLDSQLVCCLIIVEPRLAGDDSESARGGVKEGDVSPKYDPKEVSLKPFQGCFTAGATMIAGNIGQTNL